MTRDEAKALGLKHYSTGKPCKHGHIAERFVSNKDCCQCSLERQQTVSAKAKQAAYRQANMESIAVHKAAYNQANRESIAAKDAEYYKANRVEIAARNAAYKTTYRQANAKSIAAKSAEYYKANAERIALQQAGYRAANPHIVNAQSAMYRAAKLQATPHWADTAAIKAVYEQASFMSKVLGEKQHVDHIYPLVSTEVCGLHVAANLQILSATDNLKKSNKLLPMYEMP